MAPALALDWGYVWRYAAQMAYAVIVTVPAPAKVITAVPVQAVPPALGAEIDTAPLAAAP